MVRAVVQSGEGEISAIMYGNGSQIGRGPFNNLYRRIVKPGLDYLGHKALKTGLNVAGDVIEGENFGNAMRKRIKESKEDTLAQVRKKLKGNGSRKRVKGFFGRKKIGKSIKTKRKRAHSTDIFT